MKFILCYFSSKYKIIKKDIEYLKIKYEIEEYPLESNNIKLTIKDNIKGIIVMGGDGSLLRVISLLEDYRIPIYPFNYGRFGILCNLDNNNLDNFIDYNIKNINLLTVKSKNYNINFINEVLLTNEYTGYLNKFRIIVDNKVIDIINSDSIIISSSLGSTGYNRSTNGPILLSNDNIILNIVNSNKRSYKYVLTIKNTIEIEIINSKPVCVIDGNKRIHDICYKIYYNGVKAKISNIRDNLKDIYDKLL